MSSPAYTAKTLSDNTVRTWVLGVVAAAGVIVNDPKYLRRAAPEGLGIRNTSQIRRILKELVESGILGPVQSPEGEFLRLLSSHPAAHHSDQVSELRRERILMYRVILAAEAVMALILIRFNLFQWFGW